MNNKPKWAKKKRNDLVQFAKKLYFEEKKSLRKIAEEINTNYGQQISHESIRKWVQE
jgi:transposase-like protein